MAGNENKIELGDYFIADVALMPSNPVHRAIAVCDGENEGMPTFSLYSSGYESIRNHVNPEKELYYFSIVKKIAGMDEKPDVFLAPKKTVSLSY